MLQALQSGDAARMEQACGRAEDAVLVAVGGGAVVVVLVVVVQL